MINVKNLYKEFKQDDKVLHILNGINVHFKKGEKVAVLSLGYKGKLGYDINVISDGKGNFFHLIGKFKVGKEIKNK